MAGQQKRRARQVSELTVKLSQTVTTLEDMCPSLYLERAHTGTVALDELGEAWVDVKRYSEVAYNLCDLLRERVGLEPIDRNETEHKLCAKIDGDIPF